MDQGPVDAGPSNDNEYDPPSPIRRKGRPLDPLTELPQVDRPSRSQGNSVPNGLTSDPADPDAENRSQSSDPPLFTRVGATESTVEEDVYFDLSDGEKAQANFTASGRIKSEGGLQRMHKFTLYETNARYWITGSDITDRYHKMLRIDRTSGPNQINLYEDNIVYDRQQLNEILTTIDEGNRSTGGLRLKISFWGLIGFIRFTEAYYMLLITKRQQVAMLGGHYVYQIEGTELVPLTTGSSSRFARDRNPEELRFLSILGNLDLSKSFYFSYTYNITRTLQHNIIAQREALNLGSSRPDHDFNDMFVWSHHLLEVAKASLKNPYSWCLPIIHGFIDQASLDIFGRSVYITVIGRRSRFFAGARFLKRGINDLGYVANDVETEQIVSEMLTTSFHAPGPQLFANPTWTSYVHHRGSIPLYWTQDNSGVNPKPDIDLNLPDPFYQPAALHFDNLFDRYGCPVYVLNLIKSRERTPRESKLLYAYQDCIEYLNQSLPDDKRIQHKAFDMSRASKTRGGDVIGNLEIIATEIVETTGFFHNGNENTGTAQTQNGVARTNCIDCLDRTNAAQFVIGKRAFGVQLRALGVIDSDTVEYDTDAVNIFTHMFHDHGDTIAVQYGGSHLVNTMATYRKLNQWQSHSRDMVESFKRYYHNSFLDSQRQEAYNLFLGNYIWAQGQPMLWDLTTDYYLHHSDPRKWLDRPRRDYFEWYTPENLRRRELPSLKVPAERAEVPSEIAIHDNYWTEYYRPWALSSFLKVYSFRMNSSTRYLPDRAHARDSKHYDFSPFKPRLDPNKIAADTADKKPARKGVKIVDPMERINESPDQPFDARDDVRMLLASKTGVAAGHDGRNTYAALSNNGVPKDKTQMHLWNLNEIYTDSLNPSVSDSEATEYARYVEHPLNLSLVTASDRAFAQPELADYLERGRNTSAAVKAVDATADANSLPLEVDEKDFDQFLDFLEPREEALTVTDEDGVKKRYKAYRQWLKGKSLFKQNKIDPEYRSAA